MEKNGSFTANGRNGIQLSMTYRRRPSSFASFESVLRRGKIGARSLRTARTKSKISELGPTVLPFASVQAILLESLNGRRSARTERTKSKISELGLNGRFRSRTASVTR